MNENIYKKNNNKLLDNDIFEKVSATVGVIKDSFL